MNTSYFKPGRIGVKPKTCDFNYASKLLNIFIHNCTSSSLLAKRIGGTEDENFI